MLASLFPAGLQTQAKQTNSDAKRTKRDENEKTNEQ